MFIDLFLVVSSPKFGFIACPLLDRRSAEFNTCAVSPASAGQSFPKMSIKSTSAAAWLCTDRGLSTTITSLSFCTDSFMSFPSIITRSRSSKLRIVVVGFTGVDFFLAEAPPVAVVVVPTVEADRSDFVSVDDDPLVN